MFVLGLSILVACSPVVEQAGAATLVVIDQGSPCGNAVCEGPENANNCPADCSPQVSDAATPASEGETAIQDTTLYLGIMVHLEGWDDEGEEAQFRRHAELVREYADLFESYGAVLTLESKELTDGSIRWGDNVLLEMQQRGHGVGVHADIGGQRNYDCRRFADDLRAEKEQLESLGVGVLHVSGTVSHCDWVAASIEAGFEFTTGVVAYGVMSLPEALRPAEFRDCANPAACHQAYPPDLEDRLAPWRAASGADWITPVAEGGLVLIPSGGGLPCMAEERASNGSVTRCEFSEEDIAASVEELEEALSLVEPGRINTYYVSWSLGNPLDPALLAEWLAAIQPYVDSGQVQWVSLVDMYELYVGN